MRQVALGLKGRQFKQQPEEEAGLRLAGGLSTAIPRLHCCATTCMSTFVEGAGALQAADSR